ncbi:MAG: hypothetical protein ACE5OP_03895 [Candidatus Glassbacteria bacterium]
MHIPNTREHVVKYFGAYAKPFAREARKMRWIVIRIARKTAACG